MKAAPSPSRQKPRSFELQHVDHRIVVIGFEEVDVVRPDTRLCVQHRRGRSPSRRDIAPDRRERRCAARSRRGAARTAGPGRRRSRAASPRKPSAPAHGITQSNSRSGSATRRASRYCSSVSGFLNSASGFFSALLRCATQSLPKSSRVRRIGPHVIGGEKGEARVRAARAVGIDRVLRKLAERRRVAAKAVGVIGVAGNAGHDFRIAVLHRARRAADRDDAGGAAHRHMIEPAHGQPQMLGQADGGVGRKREARDRQAVDARLRDFCRGEQRRRRARPRNQCALLME